ncbi:MAG: DUF1003 domain-containing protein [Parachlamydiales bacterium]|nr:DUF1003 domain-containing protein [Parachlamydiales bacterium]
MRDILSMKVFEKREKYYRCEVCHKKYKTKEMLPIKNLGPSLLDALKQIAPKNDSHGYVCRGDLRKVRIQSIKNLFEMGDNKSEHIQRLLMQQDDNYPYSFNDEYQNELSFGEKVSQKVTPFVGSWGFVFLFVVFVSIWVTYNIQEELKKHFDPFPFVLLNLFLSCMAAVQAPIIMMAQNRLAKRERLRAEEDYYTNLKAEMEIRQLHAKLDAFLESLKNKNQ